MDSNELAMREHVRFRGKLQTAVPFALDSREALSWAYTPGVAEPCRAIAKDPERVYDLTIKGHTVAVVTDGSAVLGLGNIGPEASLPVMEGKCALFKAFGDLDAFPIALNTLDVDEIVETVKRISTVFGGVNLEDISAPRCFEVERQLVEELDIPVMHDDQHGTAVVIMAGLTNALKVVGKEMSNIRVAMSGAGAAGLAVAHLLHALGVPEIAVVDSRGILVSDREDMNAYKKEVAVYNVSKRRGGLSEAMRGADVFIGVSAPGIVSGDMVASMAKDAIIFAMANPLPEIMPEVALTAGARVVATGRSDFPNQVNNVLAFPGIFKGAMGVRARRITSEMKVAAATALAGLVESPSAERIIPDPFTPRLADTVAKAVADAWKS
ncbi:malate dehydrogenase [Candidatus Uhrbacteria bacterium RIFCSPHIGHO2_02_FULL_53_13]|uniref:Malate dehydrogenase n=1 Tax=Candidatus Uhrbacteria bacterium RIFCSPHIGHO2_02_FULL_53_13 TaxID=1802389 RepID=A0A1F7TW81_9BACT|nr:MAG: malate dehydrogenase [Candidatus Uhrbacteria bacterium RIFCSPHIGHO2_02_FULL_53_13]